MTHAASAARCTYRGRPVATRIVSVRSMTQELRTFLTFQDGVATAALDLYREVFDDFELLEMVNYGRGEIGPEGTVKVAKFRLAGTDFTCADSPIRHEWGFTPAVSLWIDCDDNSELQRLFDRLSDGGNVYMPLDNYGFSTRFGWVGDRFGVTWQLNLS
jgi:predicted 3-demethylubiquinone-9 3-methyltransferase (glyoxalase superfamily)